MTSTIEQADMEQLPARGYTDLSAEEFRAVTMRAIDKSKVLKEIVESQSDRYVVDLSPGQQYLKYEAWATIGAGYDQQAGVIRTEDIYDHDGVTILGVKAYAVVRNTITGKEVGSAWGICMYEEKNWANKPYFQLASMAGTRAAGKALRLGLSWVVVLAGYQPTPYEEMDEPTMRPSTPSQQRNRPEARFKGVVEGKVASGSGDSGNDPYLICPIHDVEWFQRGRMPGPAHKDEQDQWCNLDKMGREYPHLFVTTPAPPDIEVDDEPEPEPEPDLPQG